MGYIFAHAQSSIPYLAMPLNAVLEGSVWRSKCMYIYCVNFAENALFSSFGIINFTNAKFLDFRHSTFYNFIHKIVMHKGCIYGMYALTIGACARSNPPWSEAEALANVTRITVFNEIDTMLALKMS